MRRLTRSLSFSAFDLLLDSVDWRRSSISISIVLLMKWTCFSMKLENIHSNLNIYPPRNRSIAFVNTCTAVRTKYNALHFGYTSKSSDVHAIIFCSCCKIVENNVLTFAVALNERGLHQAFPVSWFSSGFEIRYLKNIQFQQHHWV